MPPIAPAAPGASREALQAGYLQYLTRDPQPVLEVRSPSMSLPLQPAGEGRSPGERLWAVCLPIIPAGRDIQFRILLSAGGFEAPTGRKYYRTALRTLWLQDRQIFGYRPAAQVSPSEVIKIPDFEGRLSSRALYIYLPRGYLDHVQRRYPVLYMHDGQNVFRAHEADSFAGSWRADTTADRLISEGQMRECLIVGVSHGGAARIGEYMPPYVRIKPWLRFPVRLQTRAARVEAARLSPYALPELQGRADQTFRYYQDDVYAFVRSAYRALPGREHTAVCGSSMGGLFSLYIAWQHPQFARHYAALSPAFGLTAGASGSPAALTRLESGPRPDIRLWLDSGTQDAPGRGDDGLSETRRARDLLLRRGFQEGPDFHYHVARCASHTEAAWAARLPRILRFLFPAAPTPP